MRTSILYPINLQEFLFQNSDMTTVIILLRVPGQFLNVTVFQSRISDFQCQSD